MKGRVMWWNNEKKYGFIELSAEENIFVHSLNNNLILNDGETIEFEISEQKQGKYIYNLKIIN